VVDGIDALDGALPVAAIYLPRDTGGEHGSLVMESAEYSMGRVFELSANGKSYPIRLKEVMEKGVDWLRAGFDVLSRSPADTAADPEPSRLS
jgi:cyclic-di-GMP-binding protein